VEKDSLIKTTNLFSIPKNIIKEDIDLSIADIGGCRSGQGKQLIQEDQNPDQVAISVTGGSGSTRQGKKMLSQENPDPTNRIRILVFMFIRILIRPNKCEKLSKISFFLF